ncbi:hypothetical protein HS041_12455 [Planomonospora sp. ID67723]|uniref:hypothetical protein n=1 Tax=Planomonospora sp. ID67723 TaxID=2738134 RepID=UPI0018C3A6A7|nr:hypothetical protein [Planomonospora sp. ID67723]MBG0828581.1 hypothetical protein [Planomonospora sp. ID67723]
MYEQQTRPESVPRILWGLVVLAARVAYMAVRWATWAAAWVWRRLVWPRRDQLAPLALAGVGMALGAAGHRAGVPWWVTLLVASVAVAVLRGLLHRRGVDPVHQDSITGAAALYALWATTATGWGLNVHTLRAWIAITALVVAAWALHPTPRAWRALRARCRAWAAQIPAVLAGLAMAGVVVTGITMQPGGRVLFHLRLPLGVTESRLTSERERIWSGMGWRKDSIEIRQDPDHSAADRVVLAYQAKQDVARHQVIWDPAKAAGSILQAQWWGVDQDGHDVFVPVYVPGAGSTRGLYQGVPSSAKSNHLRMIAVNGAPCDSTIYLIIDLKAQAASLRGFLPRTAWLATTEEEATILLEAAAEIIRRRGALLTPEHNGVLPPTPEHPAIIILVDEFAPIWGKKVRNQRAVEAGLIVTQQGRALAVGIEGAAQYLSENAIRPDLRALFDSHNACYRTKKKEDAQFTIPDWRDVNTTRLPTGSSYLTLAGEEYPRRLDAPEVTEAILTATARETADIAPDLEASTADGLPGWADRWSRLPEHLLAYCSDAQRELATAAPPAGVTPLRRTAASAPPRRLMVSERIDVTAPADIAADVRASAGVDPALAAMAAVFTDARGADVRTGDVVAAAADKGRGRTYATDRLAAWRGEGLIAPAGRGVWRLSCPPEGLLGAVTGVEASLGGRRRGDGS